MKNKKEKQLYVILICEMILILCIHLWNINDLYAFFLSEDELGYWGNAACFLGKDWGNTVSYCSYYSYGYSVFLMLLLSLPIQALTMYRLAIAANALFILLSFSISFYLFTHLMPNKNKIFVSIACTGMSLYTSFICQSSITWSECYLILFVWLILLQAYLISKKVTMVRIIVFALELVYIYMIHQRTIPFLIAGMVFMILLTIRKRVTIRQFIMIAVIVVIALALSSMLKTYFQSTIYNGTNTIGNDYTSITSEMSIENMIVPVIREVAGQFYYLWTATFGIVPLGIGITIMECVKKWKKKETDESIFLGFVLLSFLGILGISSIFMRLGVSRVDHLIYGRYNEIEIGFFLLMGFLGFPDFIRQRKSWLIHVMASVFVLGLAIFTLNKIQLWNISLDTYYQGVCAAGTFWFIYFRGFRVVELCVVILLAETVLFLMAKVFVKRNWIFALEIILISAFWITAGNLVIKKQIVPYQSANNQDIAENTDLWEFIEKSEEKVAFLSNTRYNIRGSIQFYMQKRPLICMQSIDELEELPGILIVDNDGSSLPDDLLEVYHFLDFLGYKSVYILSESDSDRWDEQVLDSNLFIYNELEASEEGYAVWGPYLSLSPGIYEVTFCMSSVSEGEEITGVCDVSGNGVSYAFCEWNGNMPEVTLQFQLEEWTSSVEFRYYKNAGTTIIPDEIRLNVIE